jgi:hypothetical protein
MHLNLSKSDYLYGVLILALIIILLAVFGFLYRRNIRKPTSQQWKDIQKLLKNKNNWQQAIYEADKLLDDILKEKHYKGKTMGERLVSAQHEIKANDRVWYSHKLKNKLESGEMDKVTKTEVKQTLLGFWLALKDLGAFK